MISRSVVEEPAVIDNIIIITVGSKDAVMASAITHRVISRQDLGRSAREWAGGGRTGDIANAV
jgi:hypothetical protein